jgi:hypothetical protein
MKDSWNNPVTWKKDLNKIIVKATISPRLREAARETIKALQTHNWNLAYQLTAVKSYVTGVLDPKDKVHAFQENHEANKKILGSSVYSIMDGIHHAIAFSIDALPSGAQVVSLNGIREMKSKGTHPIVRRIKYEHRQIEKDAEKRREERKFTVVPSTRKVNW